MPSPFVIVAGDFTPWGGMDRPNYELALHLASRVGAEVHLVSHRVAAPLVDHPKVTWHEVPRPFGRHSLGAPLLDRLGRWVARAVSRDGGTVVVNGGNCLCDDVNWVHYLHNEATAGRSSGISLQGLRRRWLASVDRRRERLALGSARLVIADSDRIKNRLIEDRRLHPGRVRTIYYGVDAERFRPASAAERVDARIALGLPRDRPVVAFIGGLGYDRRKGFDVLFDAWCRSSTDPGWDAVLVVAGAGPELPFWRRRVTESGREGDIRLLGFTETVSVLLTAADALVSPTRFEPYGQGVHEAICSGLPAFVTRCAGIAERFPAELHDLLLDDPPDASQLASRLREWHRDVDGYRRRTAPFSELLRRRTWSDMAADFVDAAGGGGS